MKKQVLLDYFMSNDHTDFTNQVIEYLSMEDHEIEEIQEEHLKPFDYVVTEPDDPEDMESTYIPTGEGSSYSKKSHSRPYRTGDASGYRSGKTYGNFHTKIPTDYQPEKKWPATILNIDCATNRQELIEAWDNQMRLIIMTDDNLRDDLDLIEVLAKEKTTGVANALIRQVSWAEIKIDKTTGQNVKGEDFLRHITNGLFGVFTGYDYLGQGQAEKARKVEQSLQRLEQACLVF